MNYNMNELGTNFFNIHNDYTNVGPKKRENEAKILKQMEKIIDEKEKSGTIEEMDKMIYTKCIQEHAETVAHIAKNLFKI